MYRRCIICGRKQPQDVDGNPNYHYPKTKQEAKVWQMSLNAENISIDALQKYSCVCLEHIPENSNQSSGPQIEDSSSYIAPSGKTLTKKPSQNPKNNPPPKNEKPPIGVLLMTGATLPSYCGKSCIEGENKESPTESSDKKNLRRSSDRKLYERTIKNNKDTKNNKDVQNKKKQESNTDICVLESNFIDEGSTFPEIDDTEITIRHCTLNSDDNKPRTTKDELEMEIEMAFSGEKENQSNCQCKKEEVTDVLVLGTSCDAKIKSECPCGTEGCIEEAKICCPPGCQPIPPPEPPQPEESTDDLPCGCECEQKTRTAMDVTIKKQALRIRELELLLNRQNVINLKIFGKVDELHQAFQQLNPDTEIEARKRREDEELDREQAERDSEKARLRRHPSMLFDSLAKQKSNKRKHNNRKAEFIEDNKKKEEEPKPTFLKKIQYMMVKNPETKKRRTRTQGLITTRDERDPVTGLPPKGEEDLKSSSAKSSGSTPNQNASKSKSQSPKPVPKKNDNPKDTNSKDANSKAPTSKAANPKDTNTKDTNLKSTNPKV